MGLLSWLRRRLGRGPAKPATPPRVMHLMVSGFRARCGADWTPAAPLTIEKRMVDCRACLYLMQRDGIKQTTRR